MPFKIDLSKEKLEEIKNIQCPSEYRSMDRRTFHEKLYGVVVTGDAEKARKVVDLIKSGNVLTLEIAKTLIGKKIAVTNYEYEANTPSVRIGVLTSIESEYDLAAKDTFNGYPNRLQMWKSVLSEQQLKTKQNRLKLVCNGRTDVLYGTCEIGNPYFEEPTFFGSDGDREIYYKVF